MKNNRDMVLAVVTQEGTALKFASAEMKNDRDVVLVAVHVHVHVHVHVGSSQRKSHITALRLRTDCG